MKLQLSQRALKEDFQGSFVKMILDVASKPNIISFAGGLPNPISFPIKELEKATSKILEKNGVYALQYSSTQGYLPLREFIAKRYNKAGIKVTANDILITNGSQQALDVLSAVLLNDGDAIVLEDPTYLAALQTFHLYNPTVHTVELNEDGLKIDDFQKIIEKYNPKFFYLVPNFQNPTGLTYGNKKREIVSEIIKKSDTILCEDNPYGELRFKGEDQKSFHTFLNDQCILLGTFSKTVSPGMRIGWICTNNEPLKKKMVEYKQLVDMHTNIFGQMVLAQYLEDNDYEKHIEKIKNLYHHQAETMISCMEKYFPKGSKWTEPEGGMFIWVTLPEGIKALELSKLAAEQGVAIASGDPFYEDKRDVRTLRLNYTNSDDKTIEKGISILADIIKKM